MSCAEWEVEIASESDGPELVAHLAECESCRSFARELEEDRAALASLAPPAVALDLVRTRVMSELRTRQRRTAYLWWATAAAACLAALSFGLLLPTRAPEHLAVEIATPKPPHSAPAAASTVHLTSPAHRTRRGPALARSAPEPIVIKMLTNDPDIVIIWLVDQKGDSL